MKNSRLRMIKYKRFLRRRFIRLLKTTRKRKRKTKRHGGIIVYKNKLVYSRLLRFLKDKKFEKYSTIEYNGHVMIDIPKIFSFSKNPEQTIDILKLLYFYGTNPAVKSIYFNHADCVDLGICASTIMDVILLEIKKDRKLLKRKIELGGKAPEGEVLDILEVSGVLKHLGFKEPNKNYIQKLELITCKESGYVATKVTDYFTRCLATQKFGLNKLGQQKMGEMVGEIINNCKLHGGDFSQWYTLGHYYLKPGKDYGECHLVIFNFGESIYESLKSPMTTEETKHSLRRLTNKHLGLFERHWNEESLWTLYSLQDGVSRFRDKHTPDRGTGTIKLIDCFQTIGRTANGYKPMMSITSGHTHIYFDGSYKLEPKTIDGEERLTIAFNSANDLNIKPDPHYIKILKNYFPGTIISMKFFIDHEFIRKKIEERKDEK